MILKQMKARMRLYIARNPVLRNSAWGGGMTERSATISIFPMKNWRVSPFFVEDLVKLEICHLNTTVSLSLSFSGHRLD